jgi:hypothetical protein
MFYLSGGDGFLEHRHNRRCVISRRIRVYALSFSDPPEEFVEREALCFFAGTLRGFLQLLWELGGEIFGFTAGNALAQGAQGSGYGAPGFLSFGKADPALNLV